MSAEKIKHHLSQATHHLDAAAALAEQEKRSFSWDFVYGMGGYYTPRKYGQKLQEGRPVECPYYDDEDHSYGWLPSSQSC